MEAVLTKYKQFLEIQIAMKPRSVNEYMTVLRVLHETLNTNLFTLKNPCEVDDLVIAAGRSRISRRCPDGWRQRMLYKAGAITHHFFTWAFAYELVAKNPYPFITFKKGKIPNPKFLTNDEFNHVKFKQGYTLWEQAMVSLLCDCGPRIGEIGLMEITDVQLLKRLVFIRRTKTDKPREVPFSKRTRTLLLAHISEIQLRFKTNVLFPNETGGLITSSALSKRFIRITGVNPHSIRHTVGRMWIAQGKDISIVCRLLGHTSTAMTLHYLNFTGEDLKKHADEVDQAA